MPITVECPTCEQTFRISSKYKNRKGRCPACDCSFVADESVITQASETLRAKPKPAAPPSLPLPAAVKSSSSSTLKVGLKPPSIPKASDSGEYINIDDSDIVPAESSVSDHSFTHAAEQSLIAEEIRSKHKYKSALIAGSCIAILLAGIGVALGLSGVFAKQPVANADKSDEPKKILTDDDLTKKASTDPTPEKKKVEIKPDERPTMVGIDTLHRTWSQVHPYLVQLDIVSTSGNHKATGILIDSRGWVATSYQAIKEAITVNVTMAASSLDEGPASNPQLSDLARGIIAVNPAQDIAIISVNRTLVQNVSDIAIEYNEPLVSAQRLIFCRAPKDGRRLWITDSKVDRRPRAQELEEQEKEITNRYGYKSEKNFQWIVHQRPFQPEFAGAALLNQSGQLVGMGITWKENAAESFAIPVKSLVAARDKAIRERSYENIQLFKNAGKEIAKPAGKPKAGKSFTDAPKTKLDKNASDFTLMQRINKSIEQANSIGWLASKNEDVSKLADLAKLLATSDARIKSVVKGKEEIAQAEKRLAAAIEGIQKRIDQIEILPKKAVAKSNELMLGKAKDTPQTPVLFYATVYRPSIFSPRLRSKKTVMFTIEGTKQLLITPVTDNHFDLRPGTRWILVGKVNEVPNVEVRSESPNNDADVEKCIYVDVTYVFEIVD